MPLWVTCTLGSQARLWPSLLRTFAEADIFDSFENDLEFFAM
jgi:hypothetical protein